MIDINRRVAFGNAFHLYPLLLRELATKHVFIVPAVTENGTEIFGAQPAGREIEAVQLVLMAQFITRMIQTRCRGATQALEVFAEETVAEYHKVMFDLMGATVLRADPIPLASLNKYEGEMSQIIFEALGAEAQQFEESDEEGEYPEADFWVDVFNSFGTKRKQTDPLWQKVTGRMFILRKDDFTAAARAFPEAVQ